MDAATLQALLVAIATANHHPSPPDWAAEALAAYVAPSAPAPAATAPAPATT